MADAQELQFGKVGPGIGDFEESLAFGEKYIWDLTEINPTDEDCAFCDEPEQKTEIDPFDIAISLASGQIALKGALGMMRPGYMLGVTRQHTTSFAQLSSKALSEIDTSFTAVEQRLEKALGYKGYVRLEHGSDNIESCGLGAGACVVHAHQHLIPDTGGTASHMLEVGEGWLELDEYNQLTELKGEPYLYVGHDGRHYAKANPRVVSQWGRRLVADEDGHTDWDWALFTGTMNLMQTWIKFGMMPQGRTIVNWNPGSESSAIFTPRIRPRGGGLYK